MKRSLIMACTVAVLASLAVTACPMTIGTGLGGGGSVRIIDHRFKPLKDLSSAEIIRAKEKLHIMYGHTSHGSQLTSGMQGLVAFANGGGAGMSFPDNIFNYRFGGGEGYLDYREGDGYGTGDMDHDAGYFGDNWPAESNWYEETRSYLGTADSNGRGSNHPDINVIMWSWCGQAASRTAQSMIDTYLAPMQELEETYPGVAFVYMTGHLNGSGTQGNLHQRNEQIRAHCRANKCWLFDFADIESYDPDGLVNYNELFANDGCVYDYNGNGICQVEEETRPVGGDRNWALDWQANHEEGVDWYACGASHSIPLNANRKAYAAWNLWVNLAKSF